MYFISRYQVINQLLPLNSVNFNAEIITFKVYHKNSLFKSLILLFVLSTAKVQRLF